MSSRRRSLVGSIAAAAALACAPAAGAEGWHSAQPLPPPGEEGQSVVAAPVALGSIGDIEFWAPNRGLLITAGNEAVPAGLYYYNGVSWRELSTVCGGYEGRIAWAGEDNFWTIANQQTGQQVGLGDEIEGRDRSLCHFEDGRVVASYAEPIGDPDSYRHMYAASCSGPNDCWFGGEALPSGPNGGAFHLHWNGSTMTPVPSLETSQPQLQDPPHTVEGMVFYGGRFYESVRLEQIAANESASEPYLIHRIVEGSSSPFVGIGIEGPLGTPFTFGGGEPTQLSAPRFSADGGYLWAAAGAATPTSTATPVVLTLNSGNQFEQIELSDPGGALAAGDGVGAVAAEPGTDDAWVSVDPPSESSSDSVAHLVRVHAGGQLDSPTQLPEAGEQLGHKGAAGPMVCPARGDCWVATEDGWLFHLGGSYPEDHDPDFQSLITYRPPDASIPFVAPESFPEDDSGANPPVLPAPIVPSPANHETEMVHAPLFSHVSERLLHGQTLALTFTLATKSNVELVALRNRHRVAHSKRYVLPRGRHVLRLRIERSEWPTKLELRVRAIGPVPLVPAGSAHEAVGGPTVLATSYRP